MSVSHASRQITLRATLCLLSVVAIVCSIATRRQAEIALAARICKLGGKAVTEDRLFIPRIVKVDFSGATQRIAPSLVRQIAARSSVHELKFDDSNIDSDHIEALQSARHIHRLSLVGCPIEDDSIELLGALTQLRHLNLAETQITDNAIVTLGAMRNLESLCVAASSVRIDGLAKLESKSVRSIDASGCEGDVIDLTGHGFGKLPNLTALVLRGSEVRSLKVDCISRLPELKSFDICGTSVSIVGLADALKSLSTLKNLVILDISMTDVSDESISALVAFDQLKALNISGSKITLRGAEILRAKMPNCVVHIERWMYSEKMDPNWAREVMRELDK